jgi:Serine/Threonine/Tyrosine Kinase found in polyvalent proteins
LTSDDRAGIVGTRKNAETSSQDSAKRRPIERDSPASAYRYVRRRTRADSARYGAGIIAQHKALIRWAILSDRLLETDFLRSFEPFPSGTEHEVFYDEANALAIKATHPGASGWTQADGGRQATVVEYLNRLAWHRHLFGFSIRIVGVITPEPQLRIVTSSPWVSEKVPSDRVIEQDEISAYMQSLGFSQVRETGAMYFHDMLNVFIGDAHPGNFIKSDGVIFPVDLMIHQGK